MSAAITNGAITNGPRDGAARAGSAYPVPVAELTGRVRDQAAGLGAWPSLRQVMTAHRVGRPKAAAALDALRAAGFTPEPTAAAVAVDRAPVEPTPDGRSGTDTDADAETDTGATAADAPARPEAPDASTTSPTSTSANLAAPAGLDPVTAPPQGDAAAEVSPLVTGAVDAYSAAGPTPGRWRDWPLLVISLGAFVSIWGGWVGLGEMTGFGPIRLLPGIADDFVINSAITLPLGLEAYAAFALRAWLAPGPRMSGRARRFACWSTVGALGLGAAGQVAYHLMVAAEITRAPWPITAFVSCLPVLVLGCGAALTHLTRDQHDAHDHDGEIR